ncbi:MAG: hypothetical protein WKF92_02925 [Pyrinomonadaceae bacterium]
MRNRMLKMFTIAFASLAIFANVSTHAQITPSGTNRQIRTLLTRIETNTDAFKSEIDSSLDRSVLNGTNAEDRFSDFIANFETATDELRTGFDARQDVSAEVTEVLTRARFIDRFVTRNRLSTRAVSLWATLRSDLDTLSRYYRVSWNWNERGGNNRNPMTPAYTVTDVQLQRLLARIESRTDIFKRRLETSLDRSYLNGTSSEDNLNDFLTEFENATDRLKERFDARQSVGTDVSEVLTRAQFIDRFMAANRFSAPSQTQWRNLRTDLNTLATYYRVSWNWNQTIPANPNPNFPRNSGGNFPALDSRITGTYRLNTRLSDDVHAVIDRALPHDTTTQHDSLTRSLQRRLNSPEMIAIDKRGRTVSIASTNNQQISFEADNVGRTETNAQGRTITTTANADRDGISIGYVGDRTNDFYVTFAPAANGQLRVTRRIYLENSDEQITVSSVYDKINNSAQWTAMNSGTVGGTGNGNLNDFYIPNGVRLTAVLNNAVDTKVSQPGDRFMMEVTSPSQYRGAIIEGRISNAVNSGRVSGRSNVSMDFDTIRLANGQSYRFAGIIDSVRAANGDDVSVNNEGTVRDSSQTTRTATRAGIGAVLGAIIGAVAGGGSGAAIGAGVGAGVGAGSVLVTGRDSIQLGQGSEFSITSSAPARVGSNR